MGQREMPLPHNRIPARAGANGASLLGIDLPRGLVYEQRHLEADIFLE